MLFRESRESIRRPRQKSVNGSVNRAPGSVTSRRGKRERAFPPARKGVHVNGGKSLAPEREGVNAPPPFTILSPSPPVHALPLTTMTDQMEVDITPSRSEGLNPSSSLEKMDLEQLDMNAL